MSDAQIATGKQCPFCAETIQAAAIVCRYCGRDLHAAGVPSANTSQRTDRQMLDQEMAAYTAQGWRVTSQSETSFQIAKPRQWSQIGLVLFVLLPGVGACLWYPLIGVAILGLLLVVADYLLKKEETRFITVQDIRTALTAQKPSVARIVPNESGGYSCSNCNKSVQGDAKACKHCNQALIVSAAVYAGMGASNNASK